MAFPVGGDAEDSDLMGQGLSIVAHGGSAFDIRSPSPLSYLLPTVHRYSQSRTLRMTDCPHEHEPDTGLQTFKDIVREEFDQPSDSIRRDRPHRGVRRLQGLVRLQPYQPRKRPSLLRLHLGHLQNQNGEKQRTPSVQGHPANPRNTTNGCVRCELGAEMISGKCTVPQSWTDPLPALTGAEGAEGAGFSKTSSLREQPTHLS